MTLVLTYIVSNPLVLLKQLYFPFTMCLVITLLMILLLIDLMQFSTLVYVLLFLQRDSQAFFLECPLYSVPRTNLLSSAASIFADTWSFMSKAQIVSVFLSGSPLLSPKQNNDLFFHVQSLKSESKRSYKSTLICIFHLLALAFLKYSLSLFCCRFD